MRIPLSADQKFWVGLVAVFVAAMGLLFFWVIPAHAKARQAEQEWTQAMALFNALSHDSTNIPSAAALRQSGEFREWVNGQAVVVDAFFSDRTALLEARLTGEGEVTRGDFKEAFLQAVGRQVEYLRTNAGKMRVENLEGAFKNYKWMSAAELPDPKDYGEILRDYWCRYYLYRAFLDAHVRGVRRLEIGSTAPLSGGFSGIPFRAELTLNPEYVTYMVEKLLAVSPESASQPLKDISELSVTAAGPGSGNACLVQIAGHMLLYRREGNAGGEPGGGSKK